MTSGTPGKEGFQRVIDPLDVLQVLTESGQKTSEILRKLKDLEKDREDKKYGKITQGGLLKALKKMDERGEVKGDIERFGFWMWKITDAGIKVRDENKEN